MERLQRHFLGLDFCLLTYHILNSISTKLCTLNKNIAVSSPRNTFLKNNRHACVTSNVYMVDEWVRADSCT